MLDALIQTLKRGESLHDRQIADAVTALTSEEVLPALKADFLTALAVKGETPEEIAAFTRELGGRSVPLPLDSSTRAGELIDVCGTGGDHLNTYNISTSVALVLASAGVTVAKHGNRAITSKSGSADVLEALGIRVDLTPADCARWLRDHQFAFLFAPLFHPAFKHIGPARKLCAERRQRTIFNFLGPLLNPARPTAQLIGVPAPQLCEPLAHVIQSLGVRRGMVVSGLVPMEPNAAYLDEISTLGPTTIAEFYQDRGFVLSELAPTNFGFPSATLKDLAGGDRDTNANIIRALFARTDRGPRRDALLLNAGAAFFVAGKAKTISEGVDLAAETIDSGRAEKKLADLVAAS